MTLFEEKLLKVLEKDKMLSPQQVGMVRDNIINQELPFEEYILRKFNIKVEQLLDIKSRVAKVSSYNYDSSKPIAKEILELIPQEIAQQYQMIPLEEKEDKLIVGMVDPTDIKAEQALRFLFLRNKIQPEVVVITDRDFDRVSTLYKGMQMEVKGALEEIEKSLFEETGDDELGKEKKKIGIAAMKETPVTKIVAVILKHAIDGNASDIHIEPMRTKIRVRYRVDGILYSSLFLPKAVHNSIVARIKILATLRLDESRIPQDGRFSAHVNGQLIDFRVSTLPTHLGETVSIRILDPAAAVLNFEDLGLVGANFTKFEEAIKSPFGMILISGPTGSGKTTTLYTALNKVNKEGVNVISLEDPIEYHIEGVSQSQVKPEIDYTFAFGLRSLVRQDPDIIMIGEIRDTETAKLAAQASLTGHLVFSTIHTNNALGVLPRLIDLGVEIFLIPSALALTVAQRLIGRLCESCKYEVNPSPKIVRMIDEELSKLPKEILAQYEIPKKYILWQAKGCVKCGNKKTKGRIAIFEVLEMTEELKRIIIEEEANALKLEQEARRQGMVTLMQDGIIKALGGIISLEDVLRVVEELR